MKNACCAVEANLVVAETRHQVVVRKCSVCGSRHIEVTLEPGEFGIMGASL